MSELLLAPCIFCGYNGAGYFQTGTHATHCPWHSVGGAEDRAGWLRAKLVAKLEAAEKMAEALTRIRDETADIPEMSCKIAHANAVHALAAWDSARSEKEE